MGEENISYLFDVDGTLTFPQKKMQTRHTLAFLDWVANKDAYIVAGSGLDKVERQIPSSILRRNRCSYRRQNKLGHTTQRKKQITCQQIYSC